MNRSFLRSAVMKRFILKQFSLALVVVILLSFTGVAEDDYINDVEVYPPEENSLSIDEGLLSIEVDPAPMEIGETDLLEAVLLDEGDSDIAAPAETIISEEESTASAEATEGKKNATVPSKLTLGKGETYDFGLKNARITSDKKSVVSVDKEKNIIKAEETGSANITVQFGGKTYICKATVLKAPNKISLSKTKLKLPATDTYSLKITLPKKTASNKLTWKSSNTKVATVNKNGVVTGIKKGTAKITVTTYNNQKATCKVTVNNDPAFISFPMESITIGKGESVTIKPVVNEGSKPKYTWSSKKKTIATVDKKGKITGKKAGSSTIITVKTQNGKKATLKVSVMAAPGSVSLSDMTVEVGSTVQLKATLKNTTASYKLTWKSSDTAIAKVDQNGVVTGKKAGTVKITVTTFNKKKATCTLTVTAKPEPTTAPTSEPTVGPTESPTIAPTESPTIVPTTSPTSEPTATPTVEPTTEPAETPDPSTTITNTELQNLADLLGMTGEQLKQATGLPLETLNGMTVDQIKSLEFTTDNLKWKLNGKREGVVVLGASQAQSKLIIPATIAGQTVLEIGASAFEGDTTLEEISLPRTIRKIGDNAFKKCENLWGIW